MRSLLGGILIVAVLFGLSGTGAATPPDALTGSWVLDDGDGSTSWTHIAAAGVDGVREVALFDTYAVFCETAGAGTGSLLSGRAFAVTSGAQVSITVTAVHCVNGSPGAVSPPFTIVATLTSAGLDFGGGFVAKRVGGS